MSAGATTSFDGSSDDSPDDLNSTDSPESALRRPRTALQSRSLLRAERLARREKRLTGLIENFAARLQKHQNARLAIGLATAVLLFLLAIPPISHLLFGSFPEAPAALMAIGFIVFLILVARTRRYHAHLRRLRRLKLFFERQRLRCLGVPIPTSPTHDAILTHPLAADVPRDLVLIGRHSLWTLIDETLTDAGRDRLLSWLSHAPLPADEIRARQEKIKSLADEAWFFSRWGLNSVTSEEQGESSLSTAQIQNFVREPFVQANFKAWFIGAWIFWVAAIATLLYGANLGWGLTPLIVFAGFSLLSLQMVESPFMKGVGLAHHLSELAPIFEALEKRAKWRAKIAKLAPTTAELGPSAQARRLNRALAFMGTQSNPLLHLVLNGLTPWTLTTTFFLERSRAVIAARFPRCLEELNELEAIGSLVVFAHYQTHIFPTVAQLNSTPHLEFKECFHPLLDRRLAVANSFAFPEGKDLGLLTGSNMAGKSTFLRAVGLNQTLANMGAPVFAESFTTLPFAVETCIEVSDSLRDGVSYFYAEVRRLKRLLDACASGRPSLYLIDEIFRGTNNRERHIGSRAVIKTLAQSADRSLGFVSTHDLELTVLEQELTGVLNLHFREEISAQGEMIFSYLLHFGPCPTTNALKIMAREGIPV